MIKVLKLCRQCPLLFGRRKTGMPESKLLLEGFTYQSRFSYPSSSVYSNKFCLIPLISAKQFCLLLLSAYHLNAPYLTRIIKKVELW